MCSDFLKGYLFFVLLFSCSKTTIGQNVFRAGLDDGRDISGYMTVYEDSSENFATWSLDSIHRFQGFNSISDLQTPTRSNIDYWCKIKIRNDDPSKNKNTNWVIKFDLGITHMKVIELLDDGTYVEHITGYFEPPDQRTYYPAFKENVVRINLKKGQTKDLLIRIRNSRVSMPPVFKTSLINADLFNEQLNRETSFNMVHLGFVLMMLVFNLFLFFFKHDRANIYYSIYLLFIAIHASYNTGDLAYWINSIMPLENPELTFFYKLSGYGGLAFYLAFISVFLNLHEQVPTWNRILKWILFLAIPFFVTDAYLMFTSNFSPVVSDTAILSYTLIFTFFTLCLLIPITTIKDNKKLFIFWGIIAMNIGLLITVYLRAVSYDFSVMPMKIGTTIEIIIFSIGIIYRQREQELAEKQTQFQLEKSELLKEQSLVETQRLSELNEFKSNVYANLTHEFKTPLTVILGMAEKLQNNPNEQELIKRNSNELLKLINRILDLSRAETNQLELNYIYDDILKYIKYLFESLKSAAQAKSIDLKMSANEDRIFMYYDESAIKHIIDNLLSNAIKFTHEKGIIEVRISEKTDQLSQKPSLHIEIIDNGIGIPMEEQKQIFDRFYQASSTKVLQTRGSGLGLALIKEIVEKLKGKVSVHSLPNQGATFHVTLPIRKVTPHTPHSPSVEPVEEFVLNNQLPIILLVEDNRDVLGYLESCFDVNGFKVITALDGQEGLDKAMAIIPDIIITDLMMPRKDGVEMIKRLKSDKRTSHVPIILLTARSDRNIRLDALKEGADVYLTKPFDKDELLIRVNRLIQTREEMKAQLNLNELSTIKDLDPFLKELNQFILDRIDDSDLNQSEIQVWASMSKTQLYRKLKSLTDMSATQYLTYFRLGEAKKALSKSTLSISEIAYKVGFSDPNYFSRRFSQTFGVTPMEFRESISSS